jgi:hypothetical protein
MLGKFKKIMIASAVIAVALALSFLAGREYAQKRLILPQNEKVDTLFIHETKLVEKPVFVEKKVIEKVPVPVSDTMVVHDTIYVYMDREQVHWQDSLSDVYASGYDVQVDSVRHHIQTNVITKERDVVVKVKPKWNVGVQVGYGALVNNGQVYASPYIGIGLSYNLLSW